MEKRKDFFNGLAGAWDSLKQPGADKFRRVAEESELRGRQAILDAGSGTGIMIPFLLEKDLSRTCTIYAVDYAEEMVSAMKNKRFPENVVIEKADIHETPFADNTFERVIANSCFPHFRSKTAALREIFRIIKPGGIFILAHPDGRKWVNERHRKHAAVKNDILPPARILCRKLERAGFKCLKTIDEESFYLIKAKKQASPA